MLGRKVHFLLEGVTETLDVVEAALHTDGADIGLTTLEELDGLEDRVMRLTPMSSSLVSAAMTEDGESLYFLSSFEKVAHA